MTSIGLIPENSAATPELWNVQYGTIQQNFDQLNASAGALALTASGLSGFINAGLAPYLAGSGTASDHTRLAAAVTAVKASGGVLLLPPSVYKCTTATAIDCPSLILSGATLWGSGATIAVSGLVWAGLHSWISGDVAVTAKQSLIPHWWGVTGDGTTSDHTAWNKLFEFVASKYTHSHIYIPPGTRSVIRSTVTLTNAEGVTIDSPQFPRQDNTWDYQASGFSWGGAAGGVMLALDRCRYVTVQGLAFWPNGKAAVAIDIDGYAGDGYGSQCVVKKFGIINRGTNADFVGVRVSETVLTNQEYHWIQQGTIICSSIAAKQTVSQITSGSSRLVRTANESWTGFDVGSNIEVAMAGAAGAILRTSVFSYVNADTILLATNALSTVTGAQTITGCGTGTAIRIGPSSNNKSIRIEDMIFNSGNLAIDCAGGSFVARDCSASDFSVDVAITNCAEPCSIERWNSENARTFLVQNWTQPFKVSDSRFGNQYHRPNGYYIDYGTLTFTGAVEYSVFDNQVPRGSKMYGLANCQAQTIAHRHNLYSSSGETIGSLGYNLLPFPYALVSDGERNLQGVLGSEVPDYRVNGAIKMNGRGYMGLQNSAPTDSDLDNSQFTPWLDETNKNLVFRVRNSAGALSMSSLSIK